VGDGFAEVYVDFEKEAIERKFAVSVLSAMSNKLLEEKNIPIFLREDESAVTYQALERIGFRSTGFRIIIADVYKRADEGV
jgi:predicted GNAT family acetyltransferase